MQDVIKEYLLSTDEVVKKIKDDSKAYDFKTCKDEEIYKFFQNNILELGPHIGTLFNSTNCYPIYNVDVNNTIYCDGLLLEEKGFNSRATIISGRKDFRSAKCEFFYVIRYPEELVFVERFSKEFDDFNGFFIDGNRGRGRIENMIHKITKPSDFGKGLGMDLLVESYSLKLPQKFHFDTLINRFSSLLTGFDSIYDKW